MILTRADSLVHFPAAGQQIHDHALQADGAAARKTEQAAARLALHARAHFATPVCKNTRAKTRSIVPPVVHGGGGRGGVRQDKKNICRAQNAPTLDRARMRNRFNLRRTSSTDVKRRLNRGAYRACVPRTRTRFSLRRDCLSS